jgi:hypothetical protein
VAVLPPGFQAALAERYVIQRELGRGGMATVYLAEDRKHHRLVALKVLHPELGSILGPERFHREIELASQLTHPHILPLYDSGSAAGQLYYVMPYIEGESLRDRLRREKQLTLDAALEITRNVAAALAYAHGRGVIHRDIKPENILLASGEAVVADFGIARAITAAGGERLTETGLAMGTPAYMSPEQAFGERDLDAHTDIYSLGCVLYEMLAGQPPYAGPTAQAIVAKRLSEPVPSLRTYRETVSPRLESTVNKALARVPADRFETAIQFASALSAGPVESFGRDTADQAIPAGSRRTALFHHRGILVGALLVVGLITALVWRRLRSTALPLNPDLIAVAPFDVSGVGLAPWGEGMVDYLSRSLDGAGTLRTVSPSIFLRRWNGRADPASAESLGHRTGSGLVVFGTIVRGGGDLLRLRAALLDVASGRTTAEVEVTGDTLGIDRVADSLAVALLTALGRTRPVGAVRNAPFGAVSLPAIKEFLRGEQKYRRSEWDSALFYYNRAVTLDSTFALAYRRLATVSGWDPPTASTFAPVLTYIEKMKAYNRGLPPRDSMLITADFIEYRGLELPDSFFPSYRVLTATLGEAARRYPGDPEVWQTVGEMKYHHDMPPGEALDAFDHAIALDSGFAPAFEHVLELAFSVDGINRARRYAEAYRSLRSDDASSPSIRLAMALMDSVPPPVSERARLLESSSARDLDRVGYEHLFFWADSAETAVEVLRSLARGSHPPVWEPFVDSVMRARTLARALLLRGHVREAGAVYRPYLARSNAPTAFNGLRDPLFELAELGAFPAETVSAALDRIGPTPLEFQRRALGWWMVNPDTTALQRFIRFAAEIADTGSSSRERLIAHHHGVVASAYLALVRGDSATALGDLAARPDSLCLVVPCYLEKLTEARLLAARGEDRKAASLLDRYRWTQNPYFIFSTLERGRIAERLGERETAIDCFQLVVDYWRRADPQLQPYVAEARSALARLTEEP